MQNPKHFHEFFNQIFFNNFFREIKVDFLDKKCIKFRATLTFPIKTCLETMYLIFLIFCSFLVDVTDNNEENWEKYLGDKDDAHSSIMIRFPDGNRVTKDIPCSSQFQVRIFHFLLLFT